MIFENVQEVLSEQLGANKEEITLETQIKKDLDADSLDAVEIAIALEDIYNIEIPEEELEKFVTVSDIVKYIENVQ